MEPNQPPIPDNTQNTPLSTFIPKNIQTTYVPSPENTRSERWYIGGAVVLIFLAITGWFFAFSDFAPQNLTRSTGSAPGSQNYGNGGNSCSVDYEIIELCTYKFWADNYAPENIKKEIYAELDEELDYYLEDYGINLFSSCPSDHETFSACLTELIMTEIGQEYEYYDDYDEDDYYDYDEDDYTNSNTLEQL